MQAVVLFANFFSSSYYMPHGYCYLWQTPLVGLHLVSDALIAIAYFSIPVMLIYFVGKRSDIPFSKVFVLFGAFIVLCGVGHLLDIWTLWHPDYWISGIERGLTAFVSCYTALQLIELLPQFLALRTPEQLEAINQELQTEMAKRQRAEQTLESILVGTASVTGTAFFAALAENLATALNVRYSFVTEIANPELGKMRTVAFWGDNRIQDNFEYDMSDTPCEMVIKHEKIQYFPERVQEKFPLATGLSLIQADSYLGVRLVDGEENTLGTLCISDDKPLADAESAKAVMSIFAIKAAAELQRQRAELALQRAYHDLDQRVQERTAELVLANRTLEAEITERIATQIAIQQQAEELRMAKKLLMLRIELKVSF